MRMRKKKHCDERLEKCSSLWIKNPEEYIGKWSEIFGNSNPIHIEIGCGKGQFVCNMAKQHPDINYIAIDVVPDVLVIALEKASAQEVENVRSNFSNMDSCIFCHYIPSHKKRQDRFICK